MAVDSPWSFYPGRALRVNGVLCVSFSFVFGVETGVGYGGVFSYSFSVTTIWGLRMCVYYSYL